MDSTLFSERNKLVPSNFLKFRCRMESTQGNDVHRDFTGVYYPRWRGMYLDEVRAILGEVKTFSIFPFDIYLKPDNEFFMTSDFVVGAKLVFGRSQSLRDKGVKCFVITHVDDARLRTITHSVSHEFREQPLSRKVIESLVAIRDAFIHQVGGSLELGIKNIGRRFRVVDECGDRRMDKHEFRRAVHDVHVDLTASEVDDIFASFKETPDGTISFEDFLTVVRGPMSDARKRAIASAFRKIDFTGSGALTLHDLIVKYNTKKHPDVRSGHLTEAQVSLLFVTQWDTREPRGKVTFAEFSDYYSGISAAILDDDQFCFFVADAWTG